MWLRPIIPTFPGLPNHFYYDSTNLLTAGEGILDEDLSKNFVSQVIVLRQKAWRAPTWSMLRDIEIVAEG